jgi:hypothetical protein
VAQPYQLARLITTGDAARRRPLPPPGEPAAGHGARCHHRQADRRAALATAWLGRSSYEAALPPDWLRLEPTDVVDVVFPSGTQFRMRLTRVDVGADFSLRLEGVSETVARYVSAPPSPMPARAGRCSKQLV